MLNALAVLLLSILAIAVIGLLSFACSARVYELSEAEARRILIWYHTVNQECLAQNEDETLAITLRQRFQLPEDPQTYPEWD